ncbi:MAG: hypothetical protein LBV45_03335, partial [Xanthomonadaceae bacterium]|nr:hypothetical protein [Xanthomonadaceae bacterium]
MVGLAGFALLAASAKAAQSGAGRRTLNHLDPDGAVPRDRSAISRLSERGDIDGARDILKPHVDKGDIPGIVDRLDVSSPRDGG